MSISDEISNIRYGTPKGVLFDFRGTTLNIKEPDYVLLVGTNDKAAARWIAERYGFLLYWMTGDKP